MEIHAGSLTVPVTDPVNVPATVRETVPATVSATVPGRSVQPSVQPPSEAAWRGSRSGETRVHRLRLTLTINLAFRASQIGPGKPRPPPPQILRRSRRIHVELAGRPEVTPGRRRGKAIPPPDSHRRTRPAAAQVSDGKLILGTYRTKATRGTKNAPNFAEIAPATLPGATVRKTGRRGAPRRAAKRGSLRVE